MTGDDGWLEMDADGFISLVGPFYFRPYDGSEISHYRFVAQDKHRNRGGVVHGGMLMTFADRSLGTAARRGDLHRRQVTIQLDVHFIRSVKIGDVVDFEARIIKETKTFTFTEGTMTVAGEIVATAKGIWRIWRSGPKADRSSEMPQSDYPQNPGQADN